MKSIQTDFEVLRTALDQSSRKTNAREIVEIPHCDRAIEEQPWRGTDVRVWCKSLQTIMDPKQDMK